MISASLADTAQQVRNLAAYSAAKMTMHHEFIALSRGGDWGSHTIVPGQMEGWSSQTGWAHDEGEDLRLGTVDRMVHKTAKKMAVVVTPMINNERRLSSPPLKVINIAVQVLQKNGNLVETTLKKEFS